MAKKFKIDDHEELFDNDTQNNYHKGPRKQFGGFQIGLGKIQLGSYCSFWRTEYLRRYSRLPRKTESRFASGKKIRCNGRNIKRFKLFPP